MISRLPFRSRSPRTTDLAAPPLLIGNPVTGIDFLAQNLLAESEDETTLEGARHILEQTQRISNIVQALVGFAHSGANGNPAIALPVAVAQCVDEAIYLLDLDRSATQVRYRNLCAPEHVVRADGQRLLQDGEEDVCQQLSGARMFLGVERQQ